VFRCNTGKTHVILKRDRLEVGPLVIFLHNFYEGIHSIRISNDLMEFNPVIQILQDDKETTNT
jgi:hypothetical protein